MTEQAGDASEPAARPRSNAAPSAVIAGCVIVCVLALGVAAAVGLGRALLSIGDGADCTVSAVGADVVEICVDDRGNVTSGAPDR